MRCVCGRLRLCGARNRRTQLTSTRPSSSPRSANAGAAAVVGKSVPLTSSSTALGRRGALSSDWLR